MAGIDSRSFDRGPTRREALMAARAAEPEAAGTRAHLGSWVDVTIGLRSASGTCASTPSGDESEPRWGDLVADAK